MKKENRRIVVSDDLRMGKEEGHRVQISIGYAGSNHTSVTYLNQREALNLYHRLGDYLIAHRDREELPNYDRNEDDNNE